MKKRQMLMMGMLVLCGVACAAPANVIEQVFYHQGNPKHPHHIELVSLVFYCKEDPIMNVLPDRQSQAEKVNHVFFFPQMQAQAQLFDKVNRIQTEDYSCRMEKVKTPIDGIRLTISYNPSKIVSRYELFDSIKAQKGVVFRFFNNSLIDTLRSQIKEVSVVASRERSPRVIIDCGHGGADSGAVGNMTTEKEVCLSVGKFLADYLANQGCRVVLTRVGDETVELDARTTYANSCRDAALLISLHANASVNTDARGIETFYVDPQLFLPGDKKINVPVTDVYAHLSQQRYKKGRSLAQAVHEGVVAQAKKMNHATVDRKVKKSVAQVLMGSYMPAALIELGFMTNVAEEHLLFSRAYQEALAQGIGSGIITYLKQSALL